MPKNEEKREHEAREDAERGSDTTMGQARLAGGTLGGLQRQSTEEECKEWRHMGKVPPNSF